MSNIKYQGSVKRLGLFFLFFFCLNCLASETSNPNSTGLRIGIIDTGFCLANAYDATGSLRENCDEKKKESFRNHGHWVFKELGIKTLIFPVIVFDNEAKQKPTYWKKAFHYLNENKVDLILMASSLPIEKIEQMNLEIPKSMTLFVASGQAGKSIDAFDLLWPQVLAPQENIIIIGSYFEEDNTLIENTRLLNKEKIDFYFSGESKGLLKESSLAVTSALKKAIKLCPTKAMKACLKKKSKQIKFFESHTKAFTY